MSPDTDVHTPSPPPLRLVPVDDPDAGPWTLTGDRVATIGRDEACDVHFSDPSVSRLHARVSAGPDGWVIADAGSRHGTRVNSIRLVADERVRLVTGDLLGVGAVTLSVGEPSPATESTADDETPPVPAPSVRVGVDHLATRPSIFLRLKDGRTTAREMSWNEFVACYRGVIVGFARRAGLAASDADDVLQDVLLGFFRVSDGFEYDPDRGRFRGYLKRVTLNAIRARARRARPERPGDVDLAAHDDDRLDRLWGQEWNRQTLDRALAEARSLVGAATWEAFELYGQRGVPAEEAGLQLGMSASAVRHAKSRVARSIRECLDRLRAAEG